MARTVRPAMMRNGESLCMGGWGLAIATIAEPVPAVPVSLGRARAVDHVASVNERVVGVTSRGQRGAALFPRLGAAAEGLTPTFAVGEDAAVCIHLFLRCLVSPVRLPGSPVVGYHRTGFVPYANAILPIRAPLVTRRDRSRSHRGSSTGTGLHLRYRWRRWMRGWTAQSKGAGVSWKVWGEGANGKPKGGRMSRDCFDNATALEPADGHRMPRFFYSPQPGRGVPAAEL